MSAWRDANLRSLRERFPEIARAVASARPSARLTIERSRSGLPVPSIDRNGAPHLLHSRVDPMREAQRLVERMAAAGYFVVLGLGGGYHIRSLLSRFSSARILLIERDAELFAALVGEIDLTALVSDPRIELLLDPDSAALTRAITSGYFPALHRGLSVAPLRARIEGDPGFDELTRTIEAAIEAVARDFTVQARFGRLWFRNIVANLALAERSALEPAAGRRALVVGAGPSLDAQMERLRELRKDAALIATDAALPALLERAIRPDIVVSIDAQPYGYRHFLAGLPSSALLVVGLASPPALPRRARAPVFFAGAHPLERYLAERWRGFPFVDTAGGNVGHAALSFALGAGARHVTLLGFDYSYPRGKPYARGCHIYSTFALGASRLTPSEGATQALMFRPARLSREPLEGGFRYHTETLDVYRTRFEDAFGRGLPDGSTIDQVPGEGVTLALPRRAAERQATARSPRERSAAPSAERTAGWRQMLGEYRDRLERIEVSSDAALAALISQRRAPAELATLLPIAAAFRAEQPDGDVVAQARAWALRVIDRRLALRSAQAE